MECLLEVLLVLRIRRRLFALLTDWAIRLRPAVRDPAEFQKLAREAEWPANTRRFGVRITDFLRDRLRRRWLRIHRDD